LVEQVFADASVEGHVVGERIAEKEREKRDAGGDAHGAEEDFEVEGILEELRVVLQIPFVDECAVAHQPETVGKHQRCKGEAGRFLPRVGEGPSRSICTRANTFFISFVDRYRIRGRKPEFVFASERTAGRNSRAQRLAGEIEFQMFAGTGERLLTDNGAE